MKLSNSHLARMAVLVAATITGGTAVAQTAAPAAGMSASAASRDDVKRDRDNAAVQGTKPMGSAGITSDRPKGGPEVKKSANTGNTRDQVKSDAKSAVQVGDIPMGEAGVSKDHPKGGVGKDSMSSKDKTAVRAEAKSAVKANETPKGEAGITADAPKGGVPAKP